MTARELFERCAAAGRLPKLADAHSVYHFDVEGVGSWTLEIQNGNVRVSEGKPERFDVELRASEPDLIELARGSRAAVLIMQGRVVVRGDFQRLLQLRPLFAAATSGRSAERAVQGAPR